MQPFVASKLKFREKNVDPLPGSDSTQIFPPYCSITAFQTAKPIPVPPYASDL